MSSESKITRIHAKTLFDGTSYQRDVVLCIADGLIIAIDDDVTNSDLVLEGLIVPGFIDLQVNGGGGVLFNSEPTLSSLKTILMAHTKFGTTGMLPTVITDNILTMERAADAVSLAIKDKVPWVLGIHFEGPHISTIKKGAHSQEYIRSITAEEWKIFERKDIGHVLVTLAPECVSIEDIKRLVSSGVNVSIGHSNATYEIATNAVEAGVKGFTHLYNAMSQISGREAGVTGAALLSEQTQCGLIVDGHHVSYASCKLAIKAKLTGGIILVTDAMPPVGADLNEFDFFDRKVKCEDGKLTSSTGELAGSALTMIDAVKNTYRKLDLSIEETLRMASLYPLKFLSKPSLPIAPEALLAPLLEANFVQIDQNFSVCSTWIKGQCVYQSNPNNPSS